MKKNIVEKIWDLHVIEQREGFPDLLAIDLMLLHEVTSAQAFDVLRAQGLAPFDTRRLIATLDHSVPTRSDRLRILDDTARLQVEALRANAAQYGITLYDFDSAQQGIVHVIGPELGAVHPGMTIVCGDSHTSTHGAFGALAFGIGTTEVGHVLAASALLLHRPKTMQVWFQGFLRSPATAKDAILKLISQIGIGGANAHVIEYSGQAVQAMSMEERMTVCNMSIECGARAGLMAPDEKTFSYIQGRAYAPSAFEEAKRCWRSLASDPGAAYDASVAIDLNTLQPMVTWGTNPAQACAVSESIPEPDSLTASKALAYHGLTPGTRMCDIPVDWAFLGSCTNGRIEDLRAAAAIMKGRKVADGVTFYVVPGSEAVMQQAKVEGLDVIFAEAGAQFRMPGCSLCLGMNDDQVPAGKRCISSSNRNFVGRQGKGSLTHLASPQTVAASAVRGKITDPGEFYGAV